MTQVSSQGIGPSLPTRGVTHVLGLNRYLCPQIGHYGGTALIPAAHHGHVEAVKILLATAIDKDHVNNLGWTALLEAVILGDGGAAHIKIVRLLVTSGANANIADRDGVTPLAHAKRANYAGMVRVLSEAGAK